MQTRRVAFQTLLLGTGLGLSWGCGSSGSSEADTSTPQTDAARNPGSTTGEETSTDPEMPSGGNPAPNGDESDTNLDEGDPEVDGGQHPDGSTLTAPPADAGVTGGSVPLEAPVADAAPEDASQTDGGEPPRLAVPNDPCRRPEQCTNGGDVDDVWNVMTCFAPWQPRPIGTDPGLGCENLGCPDGFRCRTDGNCEPITCEATDDCADDFECTPEGTCERTTCATDDDCDAFCVNGGCSQSLGVCDYQTAA